ncbi:MAG: serine hydrolase [Beijerinckiaceae bacterium]|nr:serine hydrolase [Beijerinckiaceae bacterium]
MHRILWFRDRSVAFSISGLLALSIPIGLAQATSSQAAPALVVDIASGEVLYQEQASQPWYPASLTKLMTVYVALSAVRDHKIALDTPLVVSARAATMPASKMGFAPGTQVTLDNALKMLMVKSANDIAVTVAEGVSGSVEAFAEDMNQAAARLGLHESHFVNPNGLPDPAHVSSARDMALIARALYTTFPEQAGLFSLGALAFGTEVIPNHNNMLGRYPGADGMKTGFTCPAGFNVVVSAYRGGRRLLAVIMGAPTVAMRTSKAAALLDRGFAGVDRPSALLTALPDGPEAGPPDLRGQVCKSRPRAALVARFNADVERLAAPLTPSQPPGAPAAQPLAMTINQMPTPAFDPVPIHIGAEPGYTGLIAQARPPHSAVGTEPDPVAAIAYAPPVTAAGLTTGSPLRPDASALPLKGREPLRKAASHKEHKKKEAVARAKDPTSAKGAEPARPATQGKVASLAKGKDAAPAKVHEKALAAAKGKGSAPAKGKVTGSAKAAPVPPAKPKNTAAAEPKANSAQ